jgi:hypothetical protein
LLRLLPAGAFAGWDLHPQKSAAFARRTPIGDTQGDYLMNDKFVITTWVVLSFVTLSILGCVSPEQRFVGDLDGHINWNIGHYQEIEGVNFVGSEERADGRIDYIYEYKTHGFFDPAGSKCRYAMAVDKNSQLIVSWHFIGNHDYCRISN